MNVKQCTSWEDAVKWLLGQPDKQDLVWGCYFDRPALGAAKRFWQSDEWRAVRNLLPSKRGRVLDVGAGMGIASYALASDGWETTALEPDASDLVGAGAIRKLAYESSLQIKVVEEWGEQLPFSDATFDVIHARQVLHHARDLGQFCSELHRVLKPGGLLIATREHVISGPSQLDKFLANHPLHEIYGGENAYTRNEYMSRLRSVGFKLSSVLGPWDSDINLAPLDRHKLREIIIKKFGHGMGVPLLARIAFSEAGYKVVKRILAVVDRRPGRLYTFVANKEAHCR